MKFKNASQRKAVMSKLKNPIKYKRPLSFNEFINHADRNQIGKDKVYYDRKGRVSATYNAKTNIVTIFSK